jgi:DNA-binding PadR family transcriptional regulator
MALHHAVLALLADGPSHGYELKAAFDEAIGPQWGTLNIGHLYQVLSRLGTDGMVASHREPQQNRPDRMVHELTDRGREELETWLREPTVRQHGYRDDLFLKLMAVLRLNDPAQTEALADRQRGYLLGELRSLSQARRQVEEPISHLLVEAARLHIEADLALLDEVERVADEQGGRPVVSREAPSSAHGGQASRRAVS